MTRGKIMVMLCYGMREIIAHGELVTRAPASYKKFREALVREVMSMIESTYPARSDPRSTSGW